MEALGLEKPALPALPKDRLLASFSVLSSATLLSIVFSVLTTKAIAVFAGPEGIALMGLYRTLGSFVTGTILMGFGTIVVQRVSKAREQGEIDAVLGAASLLFLIQLTTVGLLGFTAAEPLGRWLLGSSFTGVTATEVRIVLAMALVNLLLALVTAAINGQSNIRAITTVYLATSVSSLALIYPLLGLGRVGLAINVGSGGLVGACIGLYFLRKIFRFSLGGSWALKWATLRASVSTSFWLISHNLAITGGLLGVQKIVARSHGLEALGGFGAALLVIDTAIMAIMSSARTYALPALGRLNDDGQKHSLMSRVLALRLLATTAAAAFLIFGAKPALMLLFSRRFLDSSEVMAILSLSMVFMSYSWTYNSFLLHKGDMRAFVIIDMLWIVLMLAAVKLCDFLGLSVTAMAWCYTGSCIVSAALYAVFCSRRYGFSLLTGHNIRLGGACIAWLLASFLVARNPSLPLQGAFIGLSAAAAWMLGLVDRMRGLLQMDRCAI